MMARLQGTLSLISKPFSHDPHPIMHLLHVKKIEPRFCNIFVILIVICCLSSVIIREISKMWLAAVPIFQGTNSKDRHRSLPRSGSRYGEPWHPHTSWMAPRLCRILHRPRKDFRQTEQLSWPRSQRFELLSPHIKFYACVSLLTNGFLHHQTEGKITSFRLANEKRLFFFRNWKTSCMLCLWAIKSANLCP